MLLGVSTLFVVQDLKFYMDILGVEFVSEQENKSRGATSFNFLRK